MRFKSLVTNHKTLEHLVLLKRFRRIVEENIVRGGPQTGKLRGAKTKPSH